MAARFVGEADGATLVEYGMVVALIAIMVMGALYMLGGSIAVKIDRIATCLTTHVC